MGASKSWREIRGQRALNEARVETYKRVIEAQSQIGDLLLSRGVTNEQIDLALAAAHPDVPAEGPEEEVYLSSLSRFVAALGGHLEVHAVFPEESVTILRTDEATPGDDQISGSEAS